MDCLQRRLRADDKTTGVQNFQTSTAVYYGARPVFEEARNLFFIAFTFKLLR